MDFHTSLVAWGIALAAGTSLALLCSWVLSVVDAVPPDDLRFRGRPPRLIALARGPIRILAFHLAPLVPARLERWLDRRLKMAGVSQAVTPSEMAAGCVLSAAVAALALGLGLALIGAYNDWVVLAMVPLGAFYPVHWLQATIAQRHRALLRQLPDFLDVVTLSLEAGRNVQSALTEALAKSPAGPLSEEFSRALAELETGTPWLDALAHLSERVNAPPIATVVAVISNAQRSGASLGPTMRAQADQSRMERFARAETLAMQAPVKMLFPLMVCIMPCTFLVLGFLVVSKFLQSGT